MTYPRTLTHFLAAADPPAADALRTALDQLGAEYVAQIFPSAFTFALEGNHTPADVLNGLRPTVAGSRLAVIGMPLTSDSAAYPASTDALAIVRDSIPPPLLERLLPK